ncbi:hypothetical protein OA094_01245 [Candidatus Pelagibacter sp.]|nr:hypothetical protein [Candidatus Pelagibacter sp.]
MKKQNLIKKMMIALSVFTISIQPVNANEKKLNVLSQKFNHFLNCFKKNIETEVEKTKEFQIKKWKEAKDQNRKTFKLVQHKLTGFFSDFPNPKGDK